MIEIKFDEEKTKSLFFAFKKDSILGNLSLSELFDLLEMSKIIQYEPGEYIITQNHNDTNLYILISGSMEIIHNGRQIKTTDRVGEIIGEMSLISNNPRSASVRGLDKVQCLSIDASYLERPEIGLKSILYYIFCQVLARRLRIVNSELSRC